MWEDSGDGGGFEFVGGIEFFLRGFGVDNVGNYGVHWADLFYDEVFFFRV